MSTKRKNITYALQRFDAGNPRSREELFRLVYDELHNIAEHLLFRFPKMRQTWSPENVISELYLRLLKRPDLNFPDRANFYQYACGVMRHLIIDYARKKHYKVQFVSEDKLLNRLGFVHVMSEHDIKALDDFLERLKKDLKTERIANVAERRIYDGMDRRELAELFEVTERTITRDLTAFREAWKTYRQS